jgi:hypothetical protein
MVSVKLLVKFGVRAEQEPYCFRSNGEELTNHVLKSVEYLFTAQWKTHSELNREDIDEFGLEDHIIEMSPKHYGHVLRNPDNTARRVTYVRVGLRGKLLRYKNIGGGSSA